MRFRSSPLGAHLFGLAVLMFVCLTAREGLAQGGPPLITDDPGTPGNGHWEINLAVTVEKRVGDEIFETPLLDANYGLGDRIQLKAEIPWILRQEEGGPPARSGLGNLLLGVKWRFVDEGARGISAAFYPQVEIETLPSSSRRGLVEPGTRWFLPLSFQKKFGAISANLEVGHTLRQGELGRWVYGLAFGHEPSERLEILVEAFGNASSRLGNTELAGNVGTRWKLSRPLTLLLSVGTGLRGASTEPRARLLAYLGVKFLL